MEDPLEVFDRSLFLDWWEMGRDGGGRGRARAQLLIVVEGLHVVHMGVPQLSRAHMDKLIGPPPGVHAKHTIGTTIDL